jgi:N utilization substance protein A
MTESQAQEKTAAEEETVLSLFKDTLGVDDEIAQMLAAEGFSSLEEIAYVPLQEMLEIDGFDEELIEALRERAKAALLTKALAAEQEFENAEPAEDLLEMEGMDRKLAFALAKNGIITREDLAEQSVDDLLEFGELDEDTAAKLIMTARKPWFADDANQM